MPPELGQVVRTHGPRSVAVLGFLFLTLLMAPFTAAGVWFGITEAPRYLLMALPPLVCGAWLGWFGLGLLRSKIVLCTDGVRVVLAGRVEDFPYDRIAYYWSQIESVEVSVEGIPAGSTQFQTLVLLREGEDVPVEVPERFSRMNDAIATVFEETTRRMVPRYREQLEHSEDPIDLVELAITPHGLVRKGNFLAWADVEAARAVRGVLTIKKKGERQPFCSIITREIPNAPALLAILAAKTAS